MSNRTKSGGDISFLGGSLFSLASPITLIACGVVLQLEQPNVNGIRIALLVIGSIQLLCGLFTICCSFVMQLLQLVLACLNDEDNRVSGIVIVLIRIILAPGCLALAFLSPITAIVVGAILPGGDHVALGTVCIVIGAIQIGLAVCAICAGICFVFCTCFALLGIGASAAFSDN